MLVFFFARSELTGNVEPKKCKMGSSFLPAFLPRPRAPSSPSLPHLPHISFFPSIWKNCIPFPCAAREREGRAGEGKENNFHPAAIFFLSFFEENETGNGKEEEKKKGEDEIKMGMKEVQICLSRVGGGKIFSLSLFLSLSARRRSRHFSIALSLK